MTYWKRHLILQLLQKYNIETTLIYRLSSVIFYDPSGN